MNNILENTRRKLNDRALPWVLKNRFHSDRINIAASRHVSLFPKLNLAFNRVKKNGNSTTMSLLRVMEQGTFVTSTEAKRRSAHLQKANPLLLLKACDFHYFVIVRNPYSRVLSAFLNKFTMRGFVKRYGKHDLTPDGFHQFVRWLADSGLDADAHWDFQQKLILGSLQDFDSVLRFEDFPNCLENLLCDRGLILPNATQQLFTTVNRDTRTGASKKIEEFYDPDSIQIVQSLYHDDFEFLGYTKKFSQALG